MSDADLLKEEIAELDAQIFRLKSSMNKSDNGVKLVKLEIITRLRGRCARSLATVQEREGKA